jgi:hypothetical protein
MRVTRNGKAINSLRDWETLAGPKRDSQWAEGRSAFELANAWLGTGTPAMPAALRDLLESAAVSSGLQVDEVHPEHRIPFDTRGGEPRNADLAFLGRTAAGTIAVTVEAKADEPFGDTVEGTLAAAVERWKQNERSQGIGRVMDLLQALLPPASDGLPQAKVLRYQLLTAAAGSLAYAAAQGAAAAVMVVHEFETGKTRAELHARNGADYNAFLLRLGCLPGATLAPGLCGPVMVPGLPLFLKAIPLYLGKITTAPQP